MAGVTPPMTPLTNNRGLGVPCVYIRRADSIPRIEMPNKASISESLTTFYWSSLRLITKATVSVAFEAGDVAIGALLAGMLIKMNDGAILLTMLSGAALSFTEKNKLIPQALLTCLKVSGAFLIIKSRSMVIWLTAFTTNSLCDMRPPARRVSALCSGFFPLLIAAPAGFGATASLGALVCLTADSAAATASGQQSWLPTISSRILKTGLMSGGGAVGFMMGGPLGAAAGALATGALIKVSCAAFRSLF